MSDSNVNVTETIAAFLQSPKAEGLTDKQIAEKFETNVTAVVRARKSIEGPNGGIVTNVPIEALILDPKLQTREMTGRGTGDKDTVERYYEKMSEGVKFPPIVVYNVGTKLLVVDGFQRILAAKKCRFLDFSAEIVRTKDGNPVTWEDAVAYACQANEEHGKPRTQADRRKALNLFLDTIALENVGGVLKLKPEWSARSVAAAVKVSDFLVKTVFRERKINNPKGKGKAEVMEEEPDGKAVTEKSDKPEKPAKTVNNPEGAEFFDSVLEDAKKNCPAYHELVKAGQAKAAAGLLAELEYFANIHDAMNDLYSVAVGYKVKDGHKPILKGFVDGFLKVRTPAQYVVCKACKGDGCKTCVERGYV